MKLLDLFCGMGGWSTGFHREGFDCTGIDIVDVGYPYRFWQRDILQFEVVSSLVHYWDVVVASPPCKDFSRVSAGLAKMHKREPPDPSRGMKLVTAAFELIRRLEPRFWVIENVDGAMKHFYPLLGSPNAVIRPYYLWGKFPRFLRESSRMAPKIETMGAKKGSIFDAPGRFSPLAPWIRSRIPFPLSLGMARACRQILEHDNEHSL